MWHHGESVWMTGITTADGNLWILLLKFYCCIFTDVKLKFSAERCHKIEETTFKMKQLVQPFMNWHIDYIILWSLQGICLVLLYHHCFSIITWKGRLYCLNFYPSIGVFASAFTVIYYAVCILTNWRTLKQFILYSIFLELVHFFSLFRNVTEIRFFSPRLVCKIT